MCDLVAHVLCGHPSCGSCVLSALCPLSYPMAGHSMLSPNSGSRGCCLLRQTFSWITTVSKERPVLNVFTSMSWSWVSHLIFMPLFLNCHLGTWCTVVLLVGRTKQGKANHLVNYPD